MATLPNISPTPNAPQTNAGSQTSDPAHYWQSQNLNLYFKTKADFSLDTAGALKYKKPATAPGKYVSELQHDLMSLGYLSGTPDGYYGASTARAVLRFQRHAGRSLRVKQGTTTKDTVSCITFNRQPDGVCDTATAKEIQLWITKCWGLPKGIYSLVSFAGGKLRQDIYTIWSQAMSEIKGKGGTLEGPYGDTTRSITFRKSTGGNSLFSLHYTGRAIDLNQGLGGGKKQRYFVAKDPVGGDLFWRIYCKTERQDGSQGKKYLKTDKIKYFDFWSKKEIDLPVGYYLDLTAFLDSKKFIRIRAHANWKSNPKGMEWWHFHYNVDIQETFLDEMELLGYSEEQLIKNGWSTPAKLDRKPG